MDPTVATIVISVITGIFSIITIKIQKNQDKLIRKIDEQTVFIETEKTVRQKLVQAEKKRDAVIEQITILSMKVNIHLINSLTGVDSRIIDDLKQTSIELEGSYKEAINNIKDISREYDTLITLSNQIQRDIETANNNTNRRR